MAAYSHWCLLCAREEDVNHDVSTFNTKVRNLISEFTLINYNIEKCPKKICDECFNFMIQVKKYRKNCKNVEEMYMSLLRVKDNDIDLQMARRKLNAVEIRKSEEDNVVDIATHTPKQIKLEPQEVQSVIHRPSSSSTKANKSRKSRRHSSSSSIEERKNKREKKEDAHRRARTTSASRKNDDHERPEEKRISRRDPYEEKKSAPSSSKQRDKPIEIKLNDGDNEKNKRRKNSRSGGRSAAAAKAKADSTEEQAVKTEPHPSTLRFVSQTNLAEMLASFARYGFRLPIATRNDLDAFEKFLRNQKLFDEVLRVLQPYIPQLLSDSSLKHVMVDYLRVLHSLLITEEIAFCLSNYRSEDVREICWHQFPNTILLLKVLIGNKFNSVIDCWCTYKNFEQMKRCNEKTFQNKK